MLPLGKLACLSLGALGACGEPVEEAGEPFSYAVAGRGGAATGGAAGQGVAGSNAGSGGSAGSLSAGGESGAPPTAGAAGSGQAGASAGSSSAGAAGTSPAGGNGGQAAGASGNTSTSGGTAGAAGIGGATPGGSGGSEPTPEPETICQPWAEPLDGHDQSVVPVEVAPKNVNVKKVVLIAGQKSDHPQGQHEFFAISATLAKLFCQVPGVVPVLVRDGWPQNEAILDGAATVVFYADGGDGHPLTDANHRAKLASVIGAGAGFANLHYAVEYPVSLQPEILPWLGGVYEAGYSANPFWRADIAALPTHPITSGMSPFSIEDEWYFGLRWVTPETGLTPLLQATPPDDKRITAETAAHPGRLETMAWAYVRANGGRAFGFTGGHWYENWFDGPDTPHASQQRRLVVNGILWTAGIAVPASGANVDVAPTDHGRWLDLK
jgi:hypothetical protein